MIKKEFEVNFTSLVPICDIEIANQIRDDFGNWNYEQSDIITLGVLYGNKVTIFQKEKTDELKFWKETLLKELNNVPVMYSLNTKMEKGGIKGFLSLNRFFEEILPFLGKSCNKDNLFEVLVRDKKVPKEDIPNDPLKGNSRLVLDKYAENDYDAVIGHNKSCLIKEYFIFINRFYFLEKFKDKIKNGWYQGMNILEEK